MNKIVVTNRSKLGWKIGSAIILIFFGLMIYLVVWFFYTGSPREIVAVADQFKPGPDWTLKQEHIEPPSKSCFVTVCPQVYRVWSSPQKLNKEEFEKISVVDTSKLTIAKSCFEKNETGKIIELCDGTGVVRGYEVTLSYSGNGYDDNSSKLVLIIEEKK